MVRMTMKMVCLGSILLSLFTASVRSSSSSSSSSSEFGPIDYGVEMMPEKPHVDALFREEKDDVRFNRKYDAEKALFDYGLDMDERDDVKFSPSTNAKKTFFDDERDGVRFKPSPDTGTSPGMVSSGSDGCVYFDDSRGFHETKNEQASMEQRRSIEQMDILILKQRDQVQNLERIIRKLEQVTERLENEFVLPLDENVHSLKSFSIHTKRQVQEASGSYRNANDDEIGVEVTDKDSSGEETCIKVNDKNADNEETSKEVVDSMPSSMEIAIKQKKKYEHGGMTIARYKPAWSEHFQLLLAVKVEGDVTCLHVLPHEGEEGLSKYVAVGVNTGRVYIFSLHGDLLVDFSTMSLHPITAMLSFFTRRNETVFLTGHADGAVFIHKLSQADPHRVHSHGDDGHNLCIEHIKSLTSHSEEDMKSALISSDDQGEGKDGVIRRSKGDLINRTVTILEVYRVGKMRYVIATDAGGNIRVFRENGTFYGAARASSRPLTFLRSPNSQRLLFLTENGVASVDLRSLSIQGGQCEGLNASQVLSYAFDASGRPKAHGFTDEGAIIHVALSGDTLRFQCNVRFRRRHEVEGQVFPQAIKGYLLVATNKELLVYNTTSHDLPRLLFATPIDEIVLGFLSTEIPRRNSHPLMACNRERLVVLGFGGGYVGMYKSNLPVYKHAHSGTKFWNSPLFVIMAILVGGWQFFSKKRDVPVPPSESHLSSNSGIVQGYNMQSAPDELKESLAGSRRFNSFPSGSMKYRNPVADLSFRTPSSSGEALSRTTSSSLDLAGENSSLEPHSYLKREAVDAKFRAATIESDFENSVSDFNSFLEKSTHNKQLRGIAGHCFRTLSEPTSF